MGKSNSDPTVLFLVSQPRSGSTMLQHILASHSEIATLPETWFLLHLLSIFQADGIDAKYNGKYAYLAIQDFYLRLGDGASLYRQEVRSMALTMYRSALAATKKSCFLEKTPRYYHILPELLETFPDAHFILLVRNPLAVLSSIVRYNFNNDVTKLSQPDRIHDLCTAPRKIAEAARFYPKRAIIVRYEDLIQKPEFEVKKICTAAGLNYEPQMVDYGGKVEFKDTTFIDKKSVYMHRRPVANYVQSWRAHYTDPVMANIGLGYLDFLGADIVEQFGYDKTDLTTAIETGCPTTKRGLLTWNDLIDPSASRKDSKNIRTQLKKMAVAAGHRPAIQQALSVLRKRIARSIRRQSKDAY